MVDIIKDKYILGQSNSGIINSPGEEIRLDLNLSLDGNDTIGGVVKGVVEDGLGNPILGALVKLMTTTYDPVMHATTNSSGVYVLNKVPIDTTFNIYAIAPGMLLKQGTITAATLAQELTMDFTLERDPSAQLAVIAGDVFDSNSNAPIGGASVSLYSISGAAQTLIAVTDTNKYGQFTFRGVAIGSYNVKITSFGYYANEVLVAASTQGQIIPLKVALTVDPNNSLGTVSGVIQDDIGNPIGSADVILYRVETNNSLTPVAFTKTNDEGVYLFENVPQATYKIKSNESTTVTVVAPNSPRYYGFSIANVTSLNPDVFDVLSNSDLAKGATYVLDNAFVAGLGGVTGGTMQIGITAQAGRNYNLTIKYLSGNSDSSIILQEDPDNNGTQTTINFPKTNGWDIADAKTVTVEIPFTSGQNQFELFNNANVATPWIGDFSIRYVPKQFTVDISSGTATNGSIILGAFATMLGGPTNGSVVVPVNVPFLQNYRFNFKYLAGDEDRPIQLDIAGVNKTNVTLPKTTDWALTSAKTYELQVDLEQGEQDFKFYNTTGAYAANIGQLSFYENVINKTFLPKDVILLGTATLGKDTNNAQYIDGIVQGNGKVQFTVTVNEQLLYDFEIQYSCEEDRVCNVMIGDTEVDYEEFYFPATGGAIKSFYVKLFLQKGENTITIYNA